MSNAYRSVIKNVKTPTKMIMSPFPFHFIRMHISIKRVFFSHIIHCISGGMEIQWNINYVKDNADNNWNSMFSRNSGDLSVTQFASRACIIYGCSRCLSRAMDFSIWQIMYSGQKTKSQMQLLNEFPPNNMVNTTTKCLEIQWRWILFASSDLFASHIFLIKWFMHTEYLRIFQHNLLVFYISANCVRLSLKSSMLSLQRCDGADAEWSEMHPECLCAGFNLCRYVFWYSFRQIYILCCW